MCVEVIFVKHNWQCWISAFTPREVIGPLQPPKMESSVSENGEIFVVIHMSSRAWMTFREIGGVDVITRWKNMD